MTHNGSGEIPGPGADVQPTVSDESRPSDREIPEPYVKAAQDPVDLAEEQPVPPAPEAEALGEQDPVGKQSDEEVEDPDELPTELHTVQRAGQLTLVPTLQTGPPAIAGGHAESGEPAGLDEASVAEHPVGVVQALQAAASTRGASQSIPGADTDKVGGGLPIAEHGALVGGADPVETEGGESEAGIESRTTQVKNTDAAESEELEDVDATTGGAEITNGLDPQDGPESEDAEAQPGEGAPGAPEIGNEPGKNGTGGAIIDVGAEVIDLRERLEVIRQREADAALRGAEEDAGGEDAGQISDPDDIPSIPEHILALIDEYDAHNQIDVADAIFDYYNLTGRLPDVLPELVMGATPYEHGQTMAGGRDMIAEFGDPKSVKDFIEREFNLASCPPQVRDLINWYLDAGDYGQAYEALMHDDLTGELPDLTSTGGQIINFDWGSYPREVKDLANWYADTLGDTPSAHAVVAYYEQYGELPDIPEGLLPGVRLRAEPGQAQNKDEQLRLF